MAGGPFPAAVAAVLSAALAAVLVPGAGASATAPPREGAATATTITVGMAASGSNVRLRAGDRLVVRLAGNPTTGYRWLQARKPRLLRLLGSEYVASSPGRIGQGGTYVFRYRCATGAGGLLRLEYARPWETKGPLRVFTLSVRRR